MSHFAFLRAEWPDLYESALKAEELANPDSRTACFYARRTLELAVQWLYRHDRSLRLPYQDHLSALLHEPTFRTALGPALHAKVKIIKDLGNIAVHSTRPVRQYDALSATRELFHFTFWLARTYARKGKPADRLAFDPKALPTTSPIPPQTAKQLQALEARLAEEGVRLKDILRTKQDLDAELVRLREEVAKAKAANTKRADTHDYSEAQTRDYFIDLLLKEAGWPLSQPQDREYRVAGMPNTQEEGFVDYVLWGDDGKPLGLVEAKRTKRDPRVGQEQAKLYADCLEKEFGQRPIIFYSNGYEHWLWDDAAYPPRSVQGFLKKDELQLLIQRRTTRKKLADAEVSGIIVERFYQHRAIRRIAEAFEKDHDRKALVVMATGAGKTRTVIALADLLLRCNWAKRVLFLADRVALVNQAIKAFKAHLPSAPPVNLVTEKDKESRVYASTYPTMMGLIEQMKAGERRFGVGHFDLIVIDEAHRSVFQKYRAIFEYFDSLLVGLTATPKDDVDKNTYTLFNLETGVPTDSYDLADAVKDGFLVPAKPISVPLKFQREGIKYDDLSAEDQEAWDALEWDEEDGTPRHVESEAVNKWLFNQDTVDKVLEHLMKSGQKVAGGDRLGKTIVFAKNHEHAKYIQERFDANYPHLKGVFARVIDFQTEYPQNLIDNFSKENSPPHIAISVDMLDTGIDVPEVVNLVFFKLVRSKTKFWQMVGRGTRLRKELFGAGEDKQFFYIFDYCQNLEYFSQDPPSAEGSSNESLGTRLFKRRLELIAGLEGSDRKETEITLRKETAAFLHAQVAAMNVNNFIVRPKRRLVEKYAKASAWEKLDGEAQAELAHEIAALPTEIVDDDVEAKQFDLLVLRLQLAVLHAEPAYKRLRKQVCDIAGLLEEKSAIPMVREQMPLILEVQSDAFWDDVTTPILENVRRKLRSLVKLIEKAKRKPIFTNFEDEMGEGQAIELPGVGVGTDYERFRAKARQFLKAHETHVTIHKLRRNEPLSAADLAELEKMLVEARVGSEEDLQRAKEESQGLAPFVRSLVGLDREAVKRAFEKFLSGKTLAANQIEFVNLILDHLTEHGTIEAAQLYESPFTDLSPRGLDGMFTEPQVAELLGVLDGMRLTTAA